MTAPRPAVPGARRVGFGEFVAFIGSLMAINALGIDIVLPALPAMGEALGIARENSRQLIVAAYVLGFGVMQIVYGPIADRIGRRPVAIVALALFAATSILAGLVGSFAGIVAVRALQGAFASAMRVLAISIVRDRYSGRQMARVMSLAFMVFLIVPILAPALGQLILYVAPWPTIFYFLAAYGAALALWAWWRIPETLHPEDRRPFDPALLAAGSRTVVFDRQSLGYTLASTAMFGGLMGFINSVQQIFEHSFRRMDVFPYVFGGVAVGMAFASYFNSRIVERLGTRFVSHWALVGFILVGLAHVLVAATGLETLVSFALFQTATMICFSLAGSNFGSLAMEPVGHMAGLAASIQGTISTVLGALLGLMIGQSFDGTTLPVASGYLLLGVCSLAVVMVVERGRLFGRGRGPKPPAQ